MAKHTFQTLRLNVEEAMKGRTWLLLPEDCRTREIARKYPFPSDIRDLQKLATIPLQPGQSDCGTVYVKRAIREMHDRQVRKVGSYKRIETAEQEVKDFVKGLEKKIQILETQANNTLSEFKAKADKGIASMSELMDLTKEGLERQMKAHLAGEDWQGERVSNAAFQGAARLVIQAVKGFGVPTGAEDESRDTVVREVAAALREQREALALQPSADDDEGPPN